MPEYSKLQGKDVHEMQKQSDFLQELFDGLNDLNAAPASEIVIRPRYIKPYLNPRTGSGLPCFYLVHIILLTLDLTSGKGKEAEKRSSILNQMSDEDICILKECISIAKSKVKLDRARIEKIIKERTHAKDYVDRMMLASSKITLASVDLWDDAVRALAEWDSAIENFVRVSQKPKEDVKLDADASVLIKPASNVSGLLDVKAFEAYLQNLQKLYENAVKKLDNANAEYKSIEKSVLKEKDAGRRADLISGLTKANKALMKAQANVDVYSESLKKAKSLQIERQNKMNSLLETEAKIAAFLKDMDSNAM